ncbi:alanine--tRNA ligase [Psittacicella hinzii]|uniref:Alanine--tRNA ligase n=1 Tax=Psittacicella hinzii TaxID=2028575 RepID=A0A3A1Y9S0_9GAMM|nr:alanine--tRNA ligase [Psittacicella hinzii]RIY34425.1 alanine--tRNA ligase [Psittacicella hinzii]
MSSVKSTAEIRRSFLEFFSKKGHQVVASSSLVPENDPTLLFINAGMNQFKNVFLGLDTRSYKRATTAQRCVRAGGKHNDLENVGFTARHHTFFEMMGNFSFGDYFKRDAIHFAWEFLTSADYLALDPNRLTVTVYHTDDEAYNIWADEIGIPRERIIRIGDNKGAPYASDNFWQMADTGPCGPCTEIFYDHGPEIWGGPPGSPEEDGDRFIEIWNIVFMQFNRHEDGTMEKLPRPSVDTGMGLERVAAVKQHVNSNYDIDVFKRLIKRASELCGVEITKDTRQSLNVIADHIRSCTFLVGDGVIPSNEGRGYVLRRIIRRAVRHGYLLGVRNTFFHKLVGDVIDVMEDAAEYLNTKTKREFIEKILRLEEEQFARTIERGINLLNDEITKLKSDNKTVLAGEVAFTLLDTFGFPLDLTVDICKENSIKVDVESFEAKMDEQRKLAKANSKFSVNYGEVIKTDLVTAYDFYNNNSTKAEATVTAIYQGDRLIDSVSSGDEAVIITDISPFYGESGGQVGDTGVIKSEKLIFDVTDTQKYALALGHHGKVAAGEVKVGDRVELEVDADRRKAIILHHSVTHLLHAAVREVLGEHVHQKGSLNTFGVSRFDISHPEAISIEEQLRIESLVNEHIRANHPVVIREMSMEEAKALGAQALFTEKYGDVVRVVAMSDWSVELCGGLHVASTGEIGLFKLLSDAGISAGVRRLEFVAGDLAVQYMQRDSLLLRELSELAVKPKAELSSVLTQNQSRIKELEKYIDNMKQDLALQKVDALLVQSETVNDARLVFVKLDDLDVQSLKTIAFELANRVQTKGIFVLANVNKQGAGNLLVAVKDLTDKFNAGNLVKELAAKLGGKGGGKPNQAMGSFTDYDNLVEELSKLKEVVKTQLLQ